jgi:tight adherence protein B
MNEQLQSFEKQIPEFLHVMEVALRSGYSLKQGLEMVAKDMNGRMAAEAQQIIDDLKSGVALPMALDQWLLRCPSRDLDLVIAAIGVQLESGGNLANKFQFIADILSRLKRVG